MRPVTVFQRADPMIPMMLGRAIVPFVLVFSVLPASAWSWDHLLRWTPPPDENLGGYRIYTSAASQSYSRPLDLGFVPASDGIAEYLLVGLRDDADVFIVMTAYSAEGLESEFSNEIVVPRPAGDDPACDDGNACNGIEQEDPLSDACASGECDGALSGWSSCASLSVAPSHVRQLWAEHLHSARRIAWRALFDGSGSRIQYRARAELEFRELPALLIASAGCAGEYEVTLRGLRPRSVYEFRVGGPDEEGRPWSPIHSLATLPDPASVRGNLRVGFFANNGTAGAFGSEPAHELLWQLASARSAITLGGGGYAYSSSAIASGLATTTEVALELWRDQASAIAAGSLFLPVLGDSETDGFAHLEREADYRPHFASVPSDGEDFGSYSFDVGAAHFVALHAPHPLTLHPETAEGVAHLDWLERDLAVARASSAIRWLVVYMHMDLFSSARSAPVPREARKALWELFRRYQVNLVLSGEANSFERTHALSGDLVNPSTTAARERRYGREDGTVFLRSGAGGRLAFPPHRSPTPPAWSARRDNELLTYVVLRLFGDRTLRVQTFGLRPGGRPRVIDRITLR